MAWSKFMEGSVKSRFSVILGYFALLAFLGGTLMTSTVFAQFETGSISGTVKDSTGAVIAGAQVTITSVDTAAERTDTTNDSGSYNITNLKPGLYEVKVTHPSFGEYKQKTTLAPAAPRSADAT